MISAALLHPGNRLLNGGTADFALFGGQPATTVGIGRAAPADHGYLAAFRPSPNSGDHEATATSAGTGSFPLPYDPVTTGAIGDGSGLPLSGGMHAAPAPTVTAPTTAPLVPAPSGAGSTATSAPLDGPLAQAALATASPTDGGIAPSPVAGAFGAPVLGSSAGAVTDGGVAAAGSLASYAFGAAFAARDATADVVGATVDAGAAAAAGTVDSASYLAGSVANHAASGVGNVTQATEATLHATTATVSDLAASTMAASDAVLGGVGDAVDGFAGATAAIADAVGTATDDVAASAGEAVGGVTGGVAGGAAEAQDSVTATVLPLVDHLAGETEAATDVLGGSDPVGGIATLTAMVSAAEVFELPAGVVPAPDPVTTAIDDVMPDGEIAPPLLGDDHVVDDLPHPGDGALGIGGL